MSLAELAGAGAKVTKILNMAQAGELDALLNPGELLGEALLEYRRNDIETADDIRRFLLVTRDVVEGITELVDKVASLPLWEEETVQLLDLSREGFEAWVEDVRKLVRTRSSYSPDLEPPEHLGSDSPSDQVPGGSSSSRRAGPSGSTNDEAPSNTPDGPATCISCGGEADTELAGMPMCGVCLEQAEELATRMFRE